MWRLSTNSLGTRLLLQLLLVAAVLSALLYLAVSSVANQAAIAAHDNILGASATAIAEQLSAGEDGVLVDIPYSAFSMLGSISEDRVFYRLYSNDETITGYDDLSLPRLQATASPQFYNADFRGAAVRAVALQRAITVMDAPVSVTVIVAQTRTGQDAIASRVTNTAAALGIAFFMVAGFLSWLATRSTVKPLHDVAGAIGRRGAHDLRALKSPIPSELKPLVDSLNRFIARLRDALHRNETFMAEAAHHVRTPLATVRTQAEIALRQAETPASRKTLRSVIRAVDESSRSATQLLDHAMISYRSDQLAKEQFDFSALLFEVVQGLSATADLKDLEITTQIESGLSYSGDRVLIECALHNLIDNAIKYSAEEGEIDITLLFTDDALRFCVCDRGRGLDSSARDSLTWRFKRGDNVADVVGSGLGLTMVEQVAAVHDGSFELSARNGGGACALLIL
ncbi:MAG: sensor histidine kinase [Pseudomonadota bacterium]